MNIIEVLLRMKDQTRGALAGFKKNVNDTKKQVNDFKSLIKTIGAGIAFTALIRNITEGEEATAKLNAAFANTGKTSGLTRQRLDELATSIQATTTYSDGLVKTAESVLLSFDKVRGQAFERTIRVAADLSARLGGDLTDSVRSLGMALQSPEEGLARLRKSGIQFDDAQKSTIKTLVESGRLTEAQNILLGELEKRFGGAAEAARNTLGGALAGLKNSFGALLGGTTEGVSVATSAINSLAQVLADPSLKQSIDSIIAGLATVIQKATEAAVGLRILLTGRGGNEFVDNDIEIERLQKLKGELEANSKNTASNRLTQILFPGSIETTRDALKEVNAELERLKARQEEILAGNSNKSAASNVDGDTGISLDSLPLVDTWELMESAAKDTTEAIAAANVELDALHKNLDGAAWQQWQADIEDSTSQLAPLLEQAAADVKRSSDETFAQVEEGFDRMRKMNENIASITRGAWEDVGKTIKNTLSDAFYDGRVSGEEFVNSVRRILSDVLASILTSGIAEALKEAFVGGSSGGSNTGVIAAFLGGMFGGNAAGGRAKGMRWVGEEGRELVDMGGGSKVYNARQLAFAGGNGGSMNYAPVNNFTIQGGGDNESLRAELLATVQYINQKDRAEFERKLARNGIEVRQ